MNHPAEIALGGESNAVPRLKHRTASTLSPSRLVLLAGVYFVVVSIGLAHHELWGDELQAWMLARDSRSIPDLLHNMRYEGHPAAWHILLFLVSRFSRDPAAMQVLHLVLATATVFVIVRWAPFTVLQKVLLTFGYFFVYEYAVISRGYVLAALALFGICAVFPSRKQNYLPIALLVAVLANTSVYGLILAFALGITLLVEWVGDESTSTGLAGVGRNPVLAALIAMTAGVAAVAQMTPPADAAFPALPSADALGWSRWRAAHSVSILWRAYVPVPLLGNPHNWDTNLLADSGYFGLLVAALLSLLLLLGAARLLVRSPYALLFFTLGSAGILAFTYLRYAGNTRHFGHLFLLLIATVWISRISFETNSLSWFRRLGARAPSTADPWLTAILITHVLAGAILYLKDLRVPFTVAQETAHFIQRSGLAALPIVGPVEASAVAGHLDRKVFYLDHQRFGTFVVWGRKGGGRARPGEAMERVRLLSTSGNSPLLLVARDLIPLDERGPNVVHLAYFAPGMLRGERYHLYLVHPNRSP